MKYEGMKRAGRDIIMGIVAAGLVFALGSTSRAAESKAKKIKLGTSCSVEKSRAVYRSSDESVAYVNKNGIVTAKKRGTATIEIKRGDDITKRKISVVANGKKKKAIGVCTGEMAITKNNITYTLIDEAEDSSQTPSVDSSREDVLRYRYSATIKVKNYGSRDARKVMLMAEIAGKKMMFSFGRVGVDETETVTLRGEVEESQVPELVEENMWDMPVEIFYGKISLKKMRVYSNDVYTLYDYGENETSVHWGTADTTPPEITGFVGGNSYNQEMPYQVVYNNDKHYDYFKYIKAEDDREGKVSLTVNTDKVNFKKPGIYKVTYTATDKAGNVAKTRAKIEVRREKQMDEIADEVLSDIIKKRWSIKKKAVAIYNYTRNHISYVGTSNKSSWEKEAVHGIRYGKGDCFTYYAVARALLTRAGIPNIEVTRYKGKGHHWWNMIYVEDGWYHYDCGPRSGGGRFCMLTDEQLTEYSRTHGNKYIWNYKKLPKSPKKKLSKVF